MSRKCEVDECNKVHAARGYCSSHYRIATNSGEFSDGKKCAIKSCESFVHTLAYCSKHYNISKAYKITPEYYEQLIIFQDNKCAICFTPDKKLYIDHDHVAGNVRGLLCHNCNSALGHFYDNKEYLKSAISYLG
jgi:hypothetical protein